MLRRRSRKVLEAWSRSRTFYLRHRNPAAVSTPSARLDRPQLPIFESSTWVDRESDPTYHKWRVVLSRLEVLIHFCKITLFPNFHVFIFFASDKDVVLPDTCKSYRMRSIKSMTAPNRRNMTAPSIRNTTANYRPISILLQFNKTFERIL